VTKIEGREKVTNFRRRSAKGEEGGGSCPLFHPTSPFHFQRDLLFCLKGEAKHLFRALVPTYQTAKGFIFAEKSFFV
jgi:hypothetical protein